LQSNYIPARPIPLPALDDVIGSDGEGAIAGIEKKGRSIVTCPGGGGPTADPLC
jgi:hypothetical protein